MPLPAPGPYSLPCIPSDKILAETLLSRHTRRPWEAGPSLSGVTEESLVSCERPHVCRRTVPLCFWGSSKKRCGRDDFSSYEDLPPCHHPPLLLMQSGLARLCPLQSHRPPVVSDLLPLGILKGRARPWARVSGWPRSTSLSTVCSEPGAEELRRPGSSGLEKPDLAPNPGLSHSPRKALQSCSLINVVR